MQLRESFVYPRSAVIPVAGSEFEGLDRYVDGVDMEVTDNLWPMFLEGLTARSLLEVFPTGLASARWAPELKMAIKHRILEKTTAFAPPTRPSALDPTAMGKASSVMLSS